MIKILLFQGLNVFYRKIGVDYMKKENKKTSSKNRGGAGDGTFYDKTSKTWGFRAVRDGKDIRRKGFKTKTEAKDARIRFLAEYKTETEQQETVEIPTVEQVFSHFLTYGAYDKRPSTITKYKSVYKNHIQLVFGERLIDSVSPQEVNNFLGRAYAEGTAYNDFEEGYQYGYVEGFLKAFYLLFGYSRRMNWLTKEKYNELCEDVTTRITMPKKQAADEDDEIVTFSRDEINRMRNRIKDSNLYVAFELGYYCGMRISEVFGLLWEDVDFKKKTITVRRQLIYDKPHWILAPVKTLKANRVIDMPDKLVDILKEHKEKQSQNKAYYGTAYKATETVRVRMKKGQDDVLTGGDFINRKEDGALLTSNSMKSWALKFETELGIHFKFHYLRHTHASYLSALNTPLVKLMERLGHKKITTTQRYYLGKNETADEIMREKINSI